MASLLANLVQQYSASTGTGNLTLIAPTAGFQSFATTFGTGATTNTFYYFISNQSAVQWEYGTGHMSASNTLVRDTVIQSSNANSAVNFSGGTLTVVNDAPQSLLTLLETTTGTGAVVLSSNPTITLGSATGLPLSTGVTGILPSANGGAGTINGIMEANGSGVTSVVSVGNGLTFSGGTLSANGFVLTTPVATTSGTSAAIAGIPATAKKISVSLNGVSTSSSSNILIQIGNSVNGYTTAGYLAVASNGSTFTKVATGFIITAGNKSTASVLNGTIDLSLESSSNENWVAHGSIGDTGVSSCYFSGGSLSGVTGGGTWQVRLTTVNGTDTFTAGEFNVQYI